MPLTNSPERWGWLAKSLHWIMALLIIGLAAVGTYMADFEPNMIRQFELTQWHKSFGFVVFSLACLRVLWRFFGPAAPSEPQNTKPWERVAAHITHYGLYVLMFAMPLSGWLMASASPLNDPDAYPTQIKNKVFDLFELPDPISPGDKGLESLFHTIHELSAWLLAALLLLHIAAALKHHFVLKDNVLLRMLPFGKLRAPKR